MFVWDVCMGQENILYKRHGVLVTLCVSCNIPMPRSAKIIYFLHSSLAEQFSRNIHPSSESNSKFDLLFSSSSVELIGPIQLNNYSPIASQNTITSTHHHAFSTMQSRDKDTPQTETALETYLDVLPRSLFSTTTLFHYCCYNRVG